MRRLHRSVFDLLAILVLAGFGWTVQHTRAGAADQTWTRIATQHVLHVGTDPGFQPFAAEQNGMWSGYDVEMMREVGRRLGVEVQFDAVSYDALYDTLAADSVDMLTSALPLAPEQGWRARFSNPYLDGGEVLVARRGSSIHDESHLAGQRVGAALGSSGDTLLRGLQHADSTIRARSDYDAPDDALRALQRGDVDAVITDAVSALGLTETDSRFVIVHGLTYEPIVVAMPVDAYQLQARIDATLHDMQTDGFFERLNARWFKLQ